MINRIGGSQTKVVHTDKGEKTVERTVGYFFIEEVFLRVSGQDQKLTAAST